MRFDFVAQPAVFLARPNRYLVVARLDDGTLIHAHCADPGRLRELLVPGGRIYVSQATPRAGAPPRRTQWDLRLVESPDGGQLVSLDTRVPNRLFREALASSLFKELSVPCEVAAEVPAPRLSRALPSTAHSPHSRFDFRLTDALGRHTWVEVKSASLVVERVALFPDAVTARGRRHLMELADLSAAGTRTVVVFIVQRPDADSVEAHRATDPAFADALESARAAGVTLLAATARVTLDEIVLDRVIPVRQSDAA